MGSPRLVEKTHFQGLPKVNKDGDNLMMTAEKAHHLDPRQDLQHTSSAGCDGMGSYCIIEERWSLKQLNHMPCRALNVKTSTLSYTLKQAGSQCGSQNQDVMCAVLRVHITVLTATFCIS